MSAAQIPQIKVDNGAIDGNIKMEDVDSPSPSAVSDAYMDDADLDDPELDFKQAYQNVWLSKLPKHLWETLAKIDDNEEIEIGTIRVEGSLEKPERVSLKLNDIASLFKATEKEYILRAPNSINRRNQKPGQVMMFSEKNRPGYKQRSNVWDVVDDDGNPGQGRSQLYEQFQKDEKRKENKGKPWQYRPRKPIPKLTALAGTVSHEFEAVPVENAEHKRFEEQRTQSLLRPKDKDAIRIGKVEAKTQYASIISSGERAAINAAANIKRNQLKENRTARWPKDILVRELFQRFRQHRFWGLRDLRISLGQPESFIKETLEEIAIMHRSGDFNGKWELKDSYKDDEALVNAAGEAPKLEDSDVDMKSEGDDDMDFEDVGIGNTQ